MAENKIKPTDSDVLAYLNSIEDEKKREDAFTLCTLMQEVTGHEPVMWGSSMIGFGSYHYKYDSGREGDAMLTGFAPRKQNFSVYIMAGFDQYDALLERLGKYKTGKACLYIKRLSDVDTAVLRELVHESVEHMRRTNPS
jgi:hypothetical protein